MKNAAVTSAIVHGLRIVVWLHTTKDPNAEEWAEGVEATLALKRKVGGDLSRFRSLVISDGGAPNAAQRKELFETSFERTPHKLALITNSLSNPIKRGVATAISWLNPDFKAVPTERFREAFAHVDLEGAVGELLPVFHELQRVLPPVETLAAVERLAAKDLTHG